MNPTIDKNKKIKKFLTIGSLLIVFIFGPFVFTSTLIYFDLAYTLHILIATILFFMSGIIFVRQKYIISIYFIALIIIGVLFLASGAIEFEFNKFPNAEPTIESIEFLRATRPLTKGVPSLTMGIAFLTFGFFTLNTNNANMQNTKPLSRIYSYLVLGIGLVWLFLGIRYFIN